jgi:CheY-like chemotaxis protein
MTKILVVDDDDMVRMTVRLILEGQGYQIDEAVDGIDGIAALRKYPGYDLIVTDIIMPDCEGIEFIGKILKEKSDRRVIAMSGGGRIRNTEFLEIAQKVGARAILAKPFEPEELLQAVARALS